MPPARPLLLALLLLLASAARGAPCLEEAESNDAPATATPLGDERCFVGELPGDDQDAFAWRVTEEDAGRPWRIEIAGIPGQVTQLDVLRVDFADNGEDVTGYESLLTWGTRDGTDATSDAFLLDPGDYTLGISKDGGEGGYHVRLLPRDAFERVARGIGAAREASGAFDVHGTIDGTAELAWVLDATDAAQRWSLDLLAPLDATLSLALLDASGATVAEADVGADGRLLLSDLGLDPDRYTLVLRGDDAPHRYRLRAVSQGAITDGHEVEPNDEEAAANELRVDVPFDGGLSREDTYDVLRFRVGAETAGRSMELAIDVEGDLRLDASLLDAAGGTLQARSGHGGALRDLVLDEGLYGLVLRGHGTGRYRLAWSVGDAPRPGVETEPNEGIREADDLGQGVRGRVVGSDVDVYRLVVEGEPQLWRVQALARDGALGEIAYLDAGGRERQVQSGRGADRVRLSNLYLLPGEHFLAVRGADNGGEVGYALRALPLGPPDAEGPPPEALGDAGDATADAAVAVAPPPGPRPEGRMELEPNADASNADALEIGAPRVGLLSETDDRDRYRFHLPGHDRIRLRIEAAEGLELAGRIGRGGEPLATIGRHRAGGDLVYDAWLEPGDYHLDLAARTPAEGYYRVVLERADPFDAPTDLEPNDLPHQARDLPARVLEGRVGEWEALDVHHLPPLDAEAELTVRIEGAARPHLVRDRAGAKSLLRPDGEGVYRGTVPAGETLYLLLERRRDAESAAYRVALELDGAELPLPPVPPELDVALTPPAAPLAAYWPQGQRAAASARLTNRGEAPLDLALTGWASDPDLRLDPGTPRLRLAPDETREVPLTLHAADDLRAGEARLVLSARDAAGAITGATATLRVDPRAEPLAPTEAWPLPEPLLGSLDAAWSGLGAKLHLPDEEATRRADRTGAGALLDGLVLWRHGFFETRLADPYAPVIDLAGDAPVAVRGFLLHPQGRPEPSLLVREFRISLSTDGTTFEPVLEGVLSAAPREQTFLLDAPRDARFVRFEPLGRQGAPAGTADRYARLDPGVATLGELKVLVAPDAPLAPDGFDLADPAKGGHLVWTEPTSVAHGSGILVPGDRNVGARLGHGVESSEWVIGFHHDRAARIERLEWVDHPDTIATGAPTFDAVTVHASTESPLGPWRELGSWRLDRSGGAVPAFELPEGTWARFLKFRAEGLRPRETYRYPDEIRVRERPADDGYRSALGEWGEANRRAAYEWTRDAALEPARPERDGNDARETAESLAPGEPVTGSVERGEDLDWYRIEVPEGRNLLRLRLEGTPTLDVVPRLVDAAGAAVAASTTTAPRERVLEAFVAPGSYYVRVAEPTRSIVFSWDTSGSSVAYRPLVVQALSRFALDVEPGVEEVNVQPWGAGFLLPSWEDDGLRLLRAIQAHDGRADSSSGERALGQAARLLAERPGRRAIVFITDAAIARDGGLWPALREARPQVFAFGMTSRGAFGPNPSLEQDLMEDYASAHGGHYAYVRTQGDMDVGFERVATWLRRPARYRIEAEVAWREPPGPGTLRVTHAAEAARPAVEIVLDASGSMGAPLPDGTPRIDAARATLRRLVRDVLPAGTPVALRAFGHVAPSSCEMALELPLAPLDPDAALARIDAIEPKLLSRTPIADALLAAGEDLAGATGTATILLVTDGEESCGGDPGAAVAALRDRGIDVRLSIVSLSLEDPAAEAAFAALAEVGGGRYLDVGAVDALAAAVAEAIDVPFEVLDAAGEVVARGRVDREAVELPTGDYRVRIGSDRAAPLRPVRVPAEAEVTLEVDGP